MRLSFVWNNPASTICSRIVDNKTKLFAANEAKRLMDPYVPFGTSGMLHTVVDAKVENGLGIVHYKQKYASFQHRGEIMVGVRTGSPYAQYGERKVTTGRKLKHSKFRHPLATSQWEVAMKTARGKDLARAIEKYRKSR